MLTLEMIEAAAQRLQPHIQTTPLLHVPASAEGRPELFVKAENLQRTGSFKFRGAFNAIAQLSPADRAFGVVACSSGNHAQGVALAAKLLGCRATIVMPKDAPATKIDGTRGYGAEVVLYDRINESREEIAESHAAKTGASLIWPYDDYNVMAGQGTCGLEIVQQLKALEKQPEWVLIPASGGGLAAGVATAVHHLMPDVQLATVEPEGFDDQTRSHLAGERIGGNEDRASVCDAILTPMPGQVSFAICHGRLAEGLIVTDEQALEAVSFAFRELKLVVEPGGAVTLAALLSGKLDIKGKTVLATLSGGNIDAPVMARALGV